MHKIDHSALASHGKLHLKHHALLVCASRETCFGSFTAGAGFPAVTATNHPLERVCCFRRFRFLLLRLLWYVLVCDVFDPVFLADLGRSSAAHALGDAGSLDIFWHV